MLYSISKYKIPPYLAIRHCRNAQLPRYPLYYVATQPNPLYRCRYAWNTWGVTVAEIRDEYGVLALIC